MTTTLLVSQIAQWVLTAALTVVVLMLARQIGLLHRRLPPAPAKELRQGLAVGETAPPFERVDVMGRPASHLVPGKLTLLVFIAPRCPTCDGLIPGLRTITRSERTRLHTVLISMGDERSTRDYVRRRGLDLPVIASFELCDEYHVYATPYALLLDSAGIARAGGLVNDLEHLESIVNIMWAETSAAAPYETNGSSDASHVMEPLSLVARPMNGGVGHDE